ncbi:MAG: hypothetical protein Q8N51_15395 [Gammaproteobacteria bacterium]|nr:hypothetical protein [Gammaproteobacteria bacterium]
MAIENAGSTLMEKCVMADEERANQATEQEEPIPFMQRVLDNPFLLLFIGVTLPTVLYIVWGILEIAQIPVVPN